MDTKIKDKFVRLWKKYFNNPELPITFYYTDEEGEPELVKPGSVSRCVIGAFLSPIHGIKCREGLVREALWQLVIASASEAIRPPCGLHGLLGALPLAMTNRVSN